MLMAEEHITLAVNSEVIKRNGGNSRRKSTGASLNEGKSITPNYLRASTGSCHDFCKFGGKHHALEAEKRRPFSRRIAPKSIDNQISVEILVPAEKKKTSVSKIKPSHAKACATAIDEISKCEVSPTAIVKPALTRKSFGGANSMKSAIVSEKKTKNKIIVVKHYHSPSSTSCLPDAPKSVKRAVSSSSEKVGVSLKQAPPKSKEEGKLYGKSVPSSKLKPSEGNTYFKSKSLKENPISSTGHFSQQTRTPKGSAKTISTSQRPRPSLVRVAIINSRKLKSSKVVSSIKNDKKIKEANPDQPKTEFKQIDDEVREKTMHIINIETVKDPKKFEEKEIHGVESHIPPLSKYKISLDEKKINCLSEEQDESEFTVTESETDSVSEYEDEEEASTLKRDEKGGPINVHSDKNDIQPLKLLFRRGKVVDIQPEDNSPRRLKFRQWRIVRENQKIKGESRRRFKKEVADYDMTVKKPGPEKVSLRHQGVVGKKDIQGLFNNVIEETASKLVETRKSKVKALVGAFETVISLQEKK